MAKGNRSQTCHVCGGTEYISGKGDRDTGQIVLTVLDQVPDQLRASQGNTTAMDIERSDLATTSTHGITPEVVEKFFEMCEEALSETTRSVSISI